ncbi:hypothetical protein PENTCL1PPCAC_27547, partial [Pristionchus entomophagus]
VQFHSCLGFSLASMDLSKSLKLLESQDSRSYEDARRAILTQLDNGYGIKQLVQYYSEQRSERALELLCSIREPHDKILLDQLAEIFPRQTLNTTILLGQILQQGPSWVPKIAFHSLFRSVTNYVIRKRQTRIVVEDIAVLLFISAYLPVCSVLPENILKTLSQTFITACELLRQRLRSNTATSKDDAESVHFDHLHYAVREYFFILYGIYPNHFTTFLREYFSDESEERQKIYRAIVEPMTTLVRFHPALLNMNKKKELEQSRWHQREPHDFLDDCKRVTIGAIPTGCRLGDGPASEAEDTSTVMSDVYRTLFPSKSSGTSLNDAWDNSEDPEDREVERALMSRIDTPPGTRSHTPKGLKEMRSLDEPMVLDGKRRRSTGPSESGEKGRKSFREKMGSIGKMMFKSSTNRMNETLNEEAGVEVEGARRNSELEEAEDAMDAIDVERVETPHAEASGSSTMVSPVSIAAAKKAEEARAAARSLRGSMRARNDSTPQKGPLPGAAPATPAASEEDGHGGVSRSRSTSFLTASAAGRNSVNRLSARLDHSVEEEREERATATTDRSENMSSNENLLRNDLVGGISESLPEQRFSISSFFKQFNRQRFRSECPPADEKSVDMGSLEWRKYEGQMGFAPDAGLLSNTSTLKRTSSCPVLVDESTSSAAALMMTTSGGTEGTRGGFITTDGPEAGNLKARRVVNMVECFPYLALIKEPCPDFFQQLEDGLEDDHEKNREMYMKASGDFHAKLKDLNMADRLPGKIYDDLSHILKGLPVEKQRDMLQARLALVNQHLLYERSCRLLHANRNRRLFGRIKQQKVYEAELRMLREQDFKSKEEKNEFIRAMSDQRKQNITLGNQLKDKAQEVLQVAAKKTEEMDSLVRRLAEAETIAKDAMEDRERFRAEHDSILRRAEDAEVELKMMEEKFEVARKECAKQQTLAAQLEQATDDLQIAERRRREETGGAASPDWTNEERVRELERELEKSRAEIERLRREMETTGLKKDESDRALKLETSKSLEMRAKLDRAARLLNEQKDAAEQKYLSLQLVVRRQEEYIAEMFSVVEEAEDRRRKESKARAGTSSSEREMENGGGGEDRRERRERSADDSSLSDTVRSPPRRSVLPDKFITDELPTNFFLIDPLQRNAEEGQRDIPPSGHQSPNEEQFVLPEE